MDRTGALRSCNHHIRALRHIRPLLTLDVANTIGHSNVASRLDYANALLHGTSAGNLDRLQVTQNSLDRTVLQAPYSASATELRRLFHRLQICPRIICKLAVITYKTRSTGIPAVSIHNYQPTRTLRSSDNFFNTWIEHFMVRLGQETNLLDLDFRTNPDLDPGSIFPLFQY